MELTLLTAIEGGNRPVIAHHAGPYLAWLALIFPQLDPVDMHSALVQRSHFSSLFL
jgi:hypothetical protein